MSPISALLNPADEFDALLKKNGMSIARSSSQPNRNTDSPAKRVEHQRSPMLSSTVDWSRSCNTPVESLGPEAVPIVVQPAPPRSPPGLTRNPAHLNGPATMKVAEPVSTSQTATRRDSFPAQQVDPSSKAQEPVDRVMTSSASVRALSDTPMRDTSEETSQPEDLDYSFLPFAMTSFQQSERASTRLAARSSAGITPDPLLLCGPPTNKQEVPHSRPSSTAPQSNQKRKTNCEVPLPEQPVPKRTKASTTTKSTTNSASSSSANGKRNATVKRSGTNGTTTVQWKYHGKIHDCVIPELQQARCMSARYKAEEASKCISCTRRWAGDTCRFQLIRLFMRHRDTGETLGTCFTQHLEVVPLPMRYPTEWNVKLEENHVQSIKRTVAKALLPVLTEELAHLNRDDHGPDGVIIRARETEVRATCDTCLTSLFSRSWMCRRCGREQCADCFATLKRFTFMEPTHPWTKEELQRHLDTRERHAQANPSFFTCCRKDDHKWFHFFPVSRFTGKELEEAIGHMQSLVPTSQTRSLTQSPQLSGSSTSSVSSTTGPPTPLTEPQRCSASTIGVFKLETPCHPRNSRDKGCIPSWKLPIFAFDELEEPVFQNMWRLGEPFGVEGLLEKLRLPWTPEYFTEKYGDQSCLIIECQDDTNKRTTVREFFSEFGRYQGRTECWKLKDWPPMSDFKSSFPTLFEDFSRAVPMPNYVRRDGVLNIASYFPTNTIAPDLGPKMYNAMASSTEAGSKGSTRLHMDMADAVNIMTYAAPKPDGSEGCAAWDIFRACDSDKIRQFLRSKMIHFKNGPPQDPIHSQQIYLDDTLRQELHDTTGVKSYRFYQRPGEAVFIPAGCAHQVSNLADCVKIAIDFVSPENVARCEQLTREFREQNHSQAWKEDVLQLRSMMWFAWQACCKQAEQSAKRRS